MKAQTPWGFAIVPECLLALDPVFGFLYDSRSVLFCVVDEQGADFGQPAVLDVAERRLALMLSQSSEAQQ